jgi:nitroreductase
MSASAFAAWDIRPLSVSDFQALNPNQSNPLNAAQAHYLLGFALLAPSAHNTFPGAFGLELSRSRIQVFLGPQHVLQASDPTGREALASVGCAVENLVIAAAQYGVACEWAPNEELTWAAVSSSAPSVDVPVGHLQLMHHVSVPNESVGRSMLAAMRDRKVVRSEFEKGALARELTTSLRASVWPSESVALELFESDPDKFAWGKLDELAMKHKLEEPAFRHELGRWLLPNTDGTSPRGMRGREFGFDDRLTLELSAQLRGEIPMASDQLAFMARAGRVGLQSAGAVCVLACLDESPNTAVSAGRVYQRCVLLAWAHGVAHAVHTGVCKVPHARAMSQATLMRGGMAPSMIFRLGKPVQAADWLRPHSSRPQLAEVLHNSLKPESPADVELTNNRLRASGFHPSDTENSDQNRISTVCASGGQSRT